MSQIPDQNESNQTDISQSTQSNQIRDSEYNAPISTEHAQYMKKMEARTVKKTNKKLELKNEKSSEDREYFNGIDRICRTIGLGCGSLYLLNKVRLNFEHYKLIFSLRFLFSNLS